MDYSLPPIRDSLVVHDRLDCCEPMTSEIACSASHNAADGHMAASDASEAAEAANMSGGDDSDGGQNRNILRIGRRRAIGI